MRWKCRANTHTYINKWSNAFYENGIHIHYTGHCLLCHVYELFAQYIGPVKCCSVREVPNDFHFSKGKALDISYRKWHGSWNFMLFFSSFYFDSSPTDLVSIPKSTQFREKYSIEFSWFEIKFTNEFVENVKSTKEKHIRNENNFCTIYYRITRREQKWSWGYELCEDYLALAGLLIAFLSFHVSWSSH